MEPTLLISLMIFECPQFLSSEFYPSNQFLLQATLLYRLRRQSSRLIDFLVSDNDENAHGHHMDVKYDDSCHVALSIAYPFQVLQSNSQALKVCLNLVNATLTLQLIANQSCLASYEASFNDVFPC